MGLDSPESSTEGLWAVVPLQIQFVEQQCREPKEGFTINWPMYI